MNVVLILIIVIQASYFTSVKVLPLSNTNEREDIMITSTIEIDNNDELHTFIENNNFLGTGSTLDPYIIENLTFNVQYTLSTDVNLSRAPLLTIKNTNKFISIENCSFNEQKSGSMGIFFLQNVTNINILQNDFSSHNNIGGISIINSGNIYVKNNLFKYIGGAIWLQSYPSNLHSNKTIEISHNYFEGNGRGIFIQGQNMTEIHDNYFKSISDKAIEIYELLNSSILEINNNIFDSNEKGIYTTFYSEGKMILISTNHFFNQSLYDIYFSTENYTASVYNNNFIYNSSYYEPLAICSPYNQYNLSLNNGTVGNYFTGNQENNKDSYYINQLSFYKKDLNPLLKPVSFNITVQNKTYLQPFFSKSDNFSQIFIILSFGGLIAIIIASIILLKKKK